MKGVIMAGGFGTRLKPLTCYLPKPMVPVVNRPMLEHIMELLKKHGIVDIVALLFHQPEKINSYFGNGSSMGVNISYVYAQEDYGTAGSVKNAENAIHDEFLIISGDVLTDFDLTAAIKFHREKKSKATLILTRVENPIAYGVVMTDHESRISRFLEKPTMGQVFSDTVNTGIYILDQEILGWVPEKTSFDFSHDLFPALMKSDVPIYGYVAEGYWKDVGNLNEYQRAHIEVLSGQADVNIQGHKYENVWMDEGVQIGEGVNFEGTVILGKNVRVGDECQLSNSVIGENTTVGSKARIARSVIWANCTIGAGATLTSDVVAFNGRVGAAAHISENVFISENTRVGDGAKILPNVKIWPDKEVEDGAVLNTSLIWGDRWLREVFTDSRVTGIANVEVSPDFGARLGAAFGAFLGERSHAAVSRDPSNVARMINRSLMSGLMSAGVHVSDLRINPIPIVRHKLRHGHESGGVYVRTSPFDQRMVDIIFFDKTGGDLPVGKTKSIERLFLQEDYTRTHVSRIGEIEFPVRVGAAYRNAFLEKLSQEAVKRAHFNMVLDYSFGGAASLLPDILGSLECNAVSLNAFVDQHRLTRNPESWNEAINQLSTIVKSLKSNVGFLIDAGAEKLFVVDEQGRYIASEQFLAVVTKLFLEAYQPKRIAVPITATNLIERLASQAGCELLYTRNDHRTMMDAAQNEGVAFVGGTRGGFIFPDFLPACDGMFAMAKILELMAITERSLGELYDSMDWPAGELVRVPCPWGSMGKVMRRVMEETEGLERMLVDGIRVKVGDEESVLVIPGRDQAYFFIHAEAPDRASVEQFAAAWREKIERWRDQP